MVLGSGVLASVILGLACVAAFYLTSIYRYAELDAVPRIERDAADADRLLLTYLPTSRGQVGFRRIHADRETELLDRVLSTAVGEEQVFQWRVAGLEHDNRIEVTFRRGLSLAQEPLEVPKPSLSHAALVGQVVNAVNNQPVPDAEVRIVGRELSATTNAEGWFRLDDAPLGLVPIVISASGFSAEQFDWELSPGSQSGIRVVLNPGLDAGQIRIVLTWDEEPADLDAHLKGPLPEGEQFHIYFHKKGDLASKEFVRLDVDDRDGQGPETITVLGVLPGTYTYFVHDYSNRDDPASDSLARSAAEVKVYQSGQTYRFRAGHDMDGNIWDVCSIEVKPDGTAEVVKTDTYRGTESKELGLYAKRTMADRQQWIGDYGGSTSSETAVAGGLQWLARHQAADGSWSNQCLGEKSSQSRCEAVDPCTGPGQTYEMAHSGLALLAFQAGGHYYFNQNTYSNVVREGLDWMVDHQRDDGGLVGSAKLGRFPGFHKHFMYEHGIAAFALTEACALATAMGEPENQRYTEAAKKAVDFIQQMQYTDGGWRYWDDPKRDGDTSVSGWQVLALKTAKEAGFPVSDRCVEKVGRFFSYREMGENGRTGYDDRIPLTEATTGVGMLAQQFLLENPEGPLVKDAAEFLADYAERKWSDRKAEDDNRDFYLWYNCTLAMFQAGGQPWQRWNPIVRDTIIGLQKHDGCARGSWDHDSKWGSTGGRIYTTALAALTLEVYYRYASHVETTDSFPGPVTEIDLSAGQPELLESQASEENGLEFHERRREERD